MKIAFLGPDRAVSAHYKAGTIKLLAHTGSKALADLAGNSDAEESGYKVVLDAWYAAFVPPGTPPAIVAKLNEKMNQSLKEPEAAGNFKAGAVEPIGGTPEEIGKIAQEIRLNMRGLVKELNIKRPTELRNSAR